MLPCKDRSLWATRSFIVLPQVAWTRPLAVPLIAVLARAGDEVRRLDFACASETPLIWASRVERELPVRFRVCIVPVRRPPRTSAWMLFTARLPLATP